MVAISGSVALTRREVSARAADLGWTRPQTARNLTHMVVLAAVLVGLGWCALASGVVVRVGVWMVMAFLVLGLAAITHEAVHSQLFPSRFANHAAGTIAGLVLVIPWAGYTPFHLQHHVHTARAGDPEGVPPQLTSKWQLFAMPIEMVFFMATLWGGTLGAATFRPPYWVRSAAQRRTARIAVAIHIAVYAALLAVVPISVLAVVWLAPVAIALLVTVPVVLGPEHLGAPVDDRATAGALQVARTTIDESVLSGGPVDQLAVTRWVRSNPAMRLVYRNHNYHNAHHYLPAVTSAHLADVQALIADRVPENMYAPSYTSFYLHLWRTL